MSKYEELAKDIVKHVGGKENINSLTNCITRLRFRLKDESIVDTEALNKNDGIISTLQAGGQYQVVIGNHVEDVREDVDKVLGKLEAPSSSEDSANKTSIFNRFIETLSGIFQPILAPLTGAGMIKGLVALLSFLLGSEFQATATYAVLNAMGDGFFMFLPIFIGYTAMKKFGGSPFLGMMIATALVYPGFADGSVTANFAEAGGLNIFGLPFSVPVQGYASSVMPIIAITFLAAYLEKTIKKIVPAMLRLFMVPFLTALVVIPLGFLIVGPTMNVVSEFIGDSFIALQDFNPILFGVVLGAAWQIFVMFGLHWALIPFAIMTTAAGDPDFIVVATHAASFAQTGAVAAVMIKTKDMKLKSVAIPAFISSWFGITEASIYGVTLPKKKPFWISVGVAGVAGAIAMALGIKNFTMGGLGVLGFVNMISPEGDISGAIWMAVVSLAAVILSFILTVVVYKEAPIGPVTVAEKTPVAEGIPMKAALVSEKVLSPVQGEFKSLEEAVDPAFSSGAMGQGFLIVPSKGQVLAPFDGEVVTVFPTGHAIGLRSNNGLELLVHVGVDTVRLEGKYFEKLVEAGEMIKAGQPLINFDIEKIADEGFVTQTPVIVTNTKDYQKVNVDLTTSTPLEVVV